MLEKPPFLTDAQWRLLTYAVSVDKPDDPRWGRIASYHTHQKSLDALLRYGLITEDFALRDPDERQKLEEHIRDCVGHARGSLLEVGDWHKALGALKTAENHTLALARKAYWITDKAKDYLVVPCA